MRFLPAALLLCQTALANEGMWTLDNLPLEQLREVHGFAPDDGWKAQVQNASLRLGGASASFVSPRGLILTNHHVALATLHKLSSPGRDLVEDGFLATSPEEELPCPGLEAFQLVSFENVTERVHEAIHSDEAGDERKAVIARLTKESQEETGLHSEIVSLYQGGEYWLYRYRKHEDIRLVMAPEGAAGFFGGDSDNFTYPRHCLDFAFFRAYENGRPVRPRHWFRWSAAGAGEGELVFVSGHPGRTKRLMTLARAELERDLILPARLESAARRLAALRIYQQRGAEQARQAQRLVFGLENGIKAMTGRLEGLKDPDIFGTKVREERAFREKLLAEGLDDRAWRDIEATCEQERPRWKKDDAVLRAGGIGHVMTGWAVQILRHATEIRKPDEERLEEFADARLETFRTRLLAEQPAFRELEEFLLSQGFAELREILGDDHPLMRDLAELGDLDDFAKLAARRTRLDDPAFREELLDGGLERVEASGDPLLRLAAIFDRHYRPLREWQDAHVTNVRRRAGIEIAKARFRHLGRSTYPDASGTLRLSHGKVAGYLAGTARVPAKTVFGGLYARSDAFDGEPPFRLGPALEKARDRVDPRVPINLVTTNDITGGNSGSPLFNRELEIVGLIFDGNLQMLSNEYVYSEKAARAVSVHSAGILEALRAVHEAPALVRELTESGR